MDKDVKKILVSVLNWGLGHASRCSSVIQELLLQGAEVEIASDGPSLALLRKSFPNLQYYHLPKYNVTYPRSGKISIAVARALPSLINSIKQEFKFIGALHAEHKFDGIISDNRYGCYHPDIPSVFLGHQLRIQMPKRSNFIESILYKAQGNYIGKFDECWVPDFPGEDNLSGSLSHNCDIGIPMSYIGALSRIPVIDNKYDKDKGLNILAIISGPENQRTLFEEKIIAALKKSDYNATVLQGLPHHEAETRKENGLEIRTHCSTEDFRALLQETDLVISRSGYSTIMDLSKTNCHALFVPTPGQSEQSYLARLMQEQGKCAWQDQESIDLEKGIADAMEKEGFISTDSSDLLTASVSSFLKR